MVDLAKGFQEYAKEQIIALEKEGRFADGLKYFEKAFEVAKNQFKNYEEARQKASVIRKKVVNQLDQYLVEFEGNFKKNGGSIYWAANAADVQNELNTIFDKSNSKNVLLGQLPILNELRIEQYLTSKKVQYNYINPFASLLQSKNKRSRHQQQSAAHIELSEIAKFYKVDENTEDQILNKLFQQVNDEFSKQLFTADVVISGANFLIADTGTVAVMDPNGGLSQSFSIVNNRVFIVGIEQIIPQLSDLYLFARLYALHAYGDVNYGSLSVLSGRKDNSSEVQGALHLIIVDNGRSSLLSNPNQRSVLEHIGFDAFYNYDALFRKIGADAYGIPYPGAAGLIFSSYLQQSLNRNYLYNAVFLDGASEFKSPIKIPLREIIIAEREKIALAEKSENDMLWRTWRSAMLSRKFLNRSNLGLVSLTKSLFKRGWSSEREFPKMSKTSFNEQWVKARPTINKSNKLTEIPKGKLLVRKPATDGLDDH